MTPVNTVVRTPITGDTKTAPPVKTPTRTPVKAPAGPLFRPGPGDGGGRPPREGGCPAKPV